MKETCIYHGHSIDLDLSHIARGGIRWTYFIDKLYCRQGATDSSPIEAVRATALALAQRSIDVLDSMHSTPVGPQSSRASAPSPMLVTMDHGSHRFAADPSRGAST